VKTCARQRYLCVEPMYSDIHFTRNILTQAEHVYLIDIINISRLHVST